MEDNIITFTRKSFINQFNLYELESESNTYYFKASILNSMYVFFSVTCYETKQIYHSKKNYVQLNPSEFPTTTDFKNWLGSCILSGGNSIYFVKNNYELVIYLQSNDCQGTYLNRFKSGIAKISLEINPDFLVEASDIKKMVNEISCHVITVQKNTMITFKKVDMNECEMTTNFRVLEEKVQSKFDDFHSKSCEKMRKLENLNERIRSLISIFDNKLKLCKLKCEYSNQLDQKESEYQNMLADFDRLKLKKSLLYQSHIISTYKYLEFIIEKIAPLTTFEFFTKVYDSKVDGDSSNQFHKSCLGKSPTLFIVEDSNNSVFGGYSTKPWELLCEDQPCQTDDNAFIFSLTTNTIYFNPNTPLQVFTKKGHGPCIESNNHNIGLIIKDNCSSHCENALKTSTIAYDKQQKFSNYFKIKSYEVYA